MEKEVDQIVISSVFGELKVAPFPQTLGMAQRLRVALTEYIETVEERRQVSADRLRSLAAELSRVGIKFTDEANRRSGNGHAKGIMAGYDIEDRMAGHTEPVGYAGPDVINGILDLAGL